MDFAIGSKKALEERWLQFPLTFLQFFTVSIIISGTLTSIIQGLLVDDQEAGTFDQEERSLKLCGEVRDLSIKSLH